MVITQWKWRFALQQKPSLLTQEKTVTMCAWVLMCVCVCVCVSKNDRASSKTQTLDSCFSLVGPHQQGEELL